MNTSFNEGELLFPHPYRLEVSVGKDFQLLLKMSPCLLGTPIAVNTWQKEPQNNYCKLPPALLRKKKFFFTGKDRRSGLKWQENAVFKFPAPQNTRLSLQYLTTITVQVNWTALEDNLANCLRKHESSARGPERGQRCVWPWLLDMRRARESSEISIQSAALSEGILQIVTRG